MDPFTEVGNVSCLRHDFYSLFRPPSFLFIVKCSILRQSRGVPDHKVSVPPLANSYLFRAPSTMTRLANVAYNPRPPLLPFNVEDENPYEYETVDFPEPNPQPRLTNTT